MKESIFPKLGKVDRRTLHGLDQRRARHALQIRLPAAGRPVAAGRSLPANRWLQLALPLLGGLFVIAFIADLALAGRRGRSAALSPDVPTEIRRLRAGLRGPVYTDSRGRFRLVAPPGWQQFTGEDSAPYDVVFRSPNDVSVSLMTTPVPYDDLPSLYADIDRREREFGIHAEVEAIIFQQRPATRRVVKLLKSKVMAIDFVADHVAHHILCETPTELFDQYQPALLALLQTYQPLTPPPARAGGR